MIPKALRGAGSSFVAETHVEYPTDTGMLWDAMRKSIVLTSRLCEMYQIAGWRQAFYNLQRLKKHWRKAQQSHRSGKVNLLDKKRKAYNAYLRVAEQYLDRTIVSVESLQEDNLNQQLSLEQWSYLQKELEKIGVFQDYAVLLMDQIRRRVLEDEVIPASEKIYSIFQPHTEWISTKSRRS